MKIIMHELEHCPNCAVVSRMLEREFGEGLSIEHRVMEGSDIDRFIERGYTSSPVIQVDGDLYSASTRQERENLIETLKIMRDHESI